MRGRKSGLGSGYWKGEKGRPRSSEAMKRSRLRRGDTPVGSPLGVAAGDLVSPASPAAGGRNPCALRNLSTIPLTNFSTRSSSCVVSARSRSHHAPNPYLKLDHPLPRLEGHVNHSERCSEMEQEDRMSFDALFGTFSGGRFEGWSGGSDEMRGRVFCEGRGCEMMID